MENFVKKNTNSAHWAVDTLIFADYSPVKSDIRRQFGSEASGCRELLYSGASFGSLLDPMFCQIR